MIDLYDTHCHLDMILQKLKLETEDDTTTLLEMSQPYIKGILQISCHPKSHLFAKQISEEYHQQSKLPTIKTAYGIHPHDAKLWDSSIQAELLTHLDHPHCIAVGECGLDYFYLQSPKEEQREVFIQHIRIAQNLNKALIVHTRDAEADTLAILKQHLDPQQLVHIHCFTGSKDFVKDTLESFPNIFFGFTGVLTFKNSESIREAFLAVPNQRILLETDAPFMAPVPHRGKTCHSGMLIDIAQTMADLKNMDIKDWTQIVKQNTQEIYPDLVVD